MGTDKIMTSSIQCCLHFSFSCLRVKWLDTPLSLVGHQVTWIDHLVLLCNKTTTVFYPVSWVPAFSSPGTHERVSHWEGVILNWWDAWTYKMVMFPRTTFLSPHSVNKMHSSWALCQKDTILPPDSGMDSARKPQPHVPSKLSSCRNEGTSWRSLKPPPSLRVPWHFHCF